MYVVMWCVELIDFFFDVEVWKLLCFVIFYNLGSVDFGWGEMILLDVWVEMEMWVWVGIFCWLFFCFCFFNILCWLVLSESIFLVFVNVIFIFLLRIDIDDSFLFGGGGGRFLVWYFWICLMGGGKNWWVVCIFVWVKDEIDLLGCFVKVMLGFMIGGFYVVLNMLCIVDWIELCFLR